MTGSRGRKIKYLSLLLATVLAFGVLSPITSLASSDSVAFAGSRAAPEKFRKYGITYGEFIKKNGEPNSAHLLVGTYLIDIVPTEEAAKNGEAAVTGEIYTAAMKSRLTYNQVVNFYRSELAGGYWVDLEGALGLDSLRYDTGKKVTDAEMEDMLITVYVSGGKSQPMVDSNGDDEKAGRVNPFLKPSPYNLDEMPEMEGILKMISDGTLSYTTESVESDEVAENQSNRFMSERLRYMFAHDEVTDVIKLHDGDFDRAKVINESLKSEPGSENNKLIEKQYDETEAVGVPMTEPLSKLKTDVSGQDRRNLYALGEDGSIRSSMRLMYHFSDTRDELTDVMDKGVNNLWELYLAYKDAAEEAGENSDDYEHPEGALDNSDKHGFIFQVCTQMDATRRGQAYYNLALNEDFHGTGPVLSIIEGLNKTGSSSIGRNIYNASYFEAARSQNNLASLVGLSSGTIGGHLENKALAEEIEKAKVAAGNKYIDYNAGNLSRGTTALSQFIYDNEMKLIDKTEIDADTESILTEAMYAVNVRDDVIKVPEKEAELLTGRLIPSQSLIFSRALAAGAPESYNDATLDEKTKKAILASQQTSDNTCEKAMEQLVNGYLARIESKDTQTTFLQNQLAWARAQKSRIAKDDYATFAEEVRYNYEYFIIKKLMDLGVEVPTDDSLGPVIDLLDEAIEETFEPDDPGARKPLEQLRDTYIKYPNPVPVGYLPKIDYDPATGLPYVKFVRDPNADNGNGLGSGAGNDGNGNNGGNGLNGENGNANGNAGNGGFGTGGDSGTGSGTGGLNDGSGSGTNGNGDGTGGSGSRLPVPNGSMLDNIEAILGQSFDDMGPDGKIELIVALNQFGTENKNQEAIDLALELLEQVMAEDNPFVYTKYTDPSGLEYVSLGAIDRARIYTKFRLVKDGLDMTMSRMDDGVSYVYRYGSPTLVRVDGKTEELTSPLASRTDAYMNRGETERFPYLDEEDSRNKLSCRAEYITDSHYACVVTAVMEPNIKRLVSLIADMYG